MTDKLRDLELIQVRYCTRCFWFTTEEQVKFAVAEMASRRCLRCGEPLKRAQSLREVEEVRRGRE